MFVRQLEMGESELKVVTMGVLATLKYWRCGGGGEHVIGRHTQEKGTKVRG